MLYCIKTRTAIAAAFAFGVFAVAAIFAPMASAAPKVAVSIKPLHGLVTQVMNGVGVPGVLFDGSASPHTASFKPSQMRALQNADLVVWIGKGLEPSLARALDAGRKTGHSLAAVSVPGLRLWPRRSGANWEEHDDHHHHDADDVSENHDPHVWLDPDNAAIIMRAVAGKLAEIDPINAMQYRENLKRLLVRLTEMSKDLERQFGSIRQGYYFVQHDAYQYLEKKFDLHPLGAVALSPERLPGPRHISTLRRRLKSSGARCVFVEPGNSKSVAGVLAGTGAQAVPLDILGFEVSAGADAYFQIMTKLSASMIPCLSGG
jgi:zinc transport system substrate-binding protein